MGMSASQMRYVLISGSKSDVEFQGQQINQQRTTLATQTSAYNSQLLTLNVPTPPSTDEYKTTSYSFSNNGETCTVTGTEYDKTKTDGFKYKINFTTATTGDLGQNRGTSTFSTDDGGNTIKANNGNTLTNVITDKNDPNYNDKTMTLLKQILEDCKIATPTTYTTSGGQTLAAVGKNATVDATDIANLKSIYGASNYNPNNTYYKYTTGGATPQTYYMTDTEIKAAGQDSTVHYIDPNTNNPATSTTKISAATVYPEFYQYISDGETMFVKKSDLTLPTTGAGSDKATSYAVEKSADRTESDSVENAKITWSNSGRMSAFTTKDADGNEETFTLSVVTADDDAAYENAYNEYEYQRSKYENQMDGINAQIDIIQTQDKKLELKLQDLDTKQKALSTEMDSIKKVIDKNIETSFKAFA